jgi:methylated-DNA-[protein]-cysteine S-methyltransferase
LAGSFHAGGGRKNPAVLMAPDCRVGPVGVTRDRYVVDGWGVGEVWAEDDVLLAHDLSFSTATAAASADLGRSPHGARAEPTTPSPNGGARPPSGTLARASSRERAGFVSDLCRRFAAHLAGDRVSYADVAVDEDWCTPFQAELLRALREIPWGEVVSYGELAALAGRPGAARAAGSFCASNRFALVVACHRVVAAEGIGGYGSSGVGTKRRLLALEGVRI